RRIAQSAARNPGVYLPDAELLALALNPHTLVAYLAIRSCADDKGVSIISQEAIAESGHIGISRVKTKAISELEDCELVQVKRPPPLHLRTDPGPLANEYTLTRPSADGQSQIKKEN
ncbi:MAG: hypothetical protein M3P44_17115, partial [Actinomycetota bacterium]|nr:hypothetical protein [Actinomycetota bacterium]